MKEHKLRQFQAAMAYEDTKIKINVDDIPVEPSYKGPKLDKIDDINS